MPIIPIRCYTCGKVIANMWESYQEQLRQGKSQDEALTVVGMRRYCCRRMFLGHVDLIDKIMLYDPAKEHQNA